MKQIMTHCFKSVQHKLHAKVGFFDLYGLDFMVDEDMKVTCQYHSVIRTMSDVLEMPNMMRHAAAKSL